MKRGYFLKFLSLGILTPILQSFSKSNEDTFDTNTPFIKLKDDYQDKIIGDDLVDGVIIKKIGKDFYINSNGRIDIKDFGAIGDGYTDDTLSVQKAINQCVKYKKSLFVSRPVKSYLCKNKIIIPGTISIIGEGMNMSGFNFLNSDGFEIQEGILNVMIEKISINQAIRYSDKQNNFIALKVLGTDSKRSFTHVYRDIFIDGFSKAFDLNWIWDSHFDNIKILYGKLGFDIKGISVNNNIVNSSISVTGKGSKGIFFSDKMHPAEGWKMSNLLTYGAEIGVHSIYTSNVFVTTPILDFCNLNGILLESGVGPSTNWQILGGYIAMEGNAHSAILLNNDKNNNQIRGNKIVGVDMLAYPGASTLYGILFKGIYDINTRAYGNTFENFKKNIEFLNGKIQDSKII